MLSDRGFSLYWWRRCPLYSDAVTSVVIFCCRHRFVTVVIGSRLRRRFVIGGLRCVLLARDHGDRVAPVYRCCCCFFFFFSTQFEGGFSGALGRIILASLLQGATLAIRCRRRFPYHPWRYLLTPLAFLHFFFGVVVRV